jgi:lysophospholipase L1-like esterase
MKRLIVACLVAAACNGLAAAQSATQQTRDCAEERQRIERLEQRLRDWPFLQRYRELNSQLGPPAKEEKRVVFLGDSITDGWKLADFFPNKPYINRGIGGQTTPQMLVRFRPDVVALKPAVVVILAGTNDIAGNTGPMTLEAIEANLASMSELARANGIRVVLASVLPVSDYAANREGRQIIQTTRRPPERILELNKWVKAYSKENGLTYLDYFSAVVDDKGFLKKDLSYDGLHLNENGYRVMAPLAGQAIASALKRKR